MGCGGISVSVFVGTIAQAHACCFSHVVQRNEVLSVVESCQKHITRVINAKKSTTLVSTATVNMDIDILNDVNSQLTKLHARLHTRFKSPYEKFLTCLLCCSMGGCFDLQKIRRMRQSRRRMKKSRIYHMGSKE